MVLSMKIMASCGEERTVSMWDPFTKKPITNLHGHTSSLVDLAINEDRFHLMTLGADKVVKVWDIRNY